MLKLSLVGVFVLSLFATAQGQDAKKTDDPLQGVKCCMMEKNNVKKEQSASYHDAMVYFCCPKCKAAFEKDSAKFAVKANQQLVQTKQFVQKVCPISGEKVDQAQTVKIGETEVQFCCDKCVAKVNAASDDEAKAKMIFSNEAFEKAFVKVESKDKAKEGKEPSKEAPAKAKKSGL